MEQSKIIDTLETYQSAHTNCVLSNIKTFQAVDIFEIARDAEAGVFGE